MPPRYLPNYGQRRQAPAYAGSAPRISGAGGWRSQEAEGPQGTHTYTSGLIRMPTGFQTARPGNVNNTYDRAGPTGTPGATRPGMTGAQQRFYSEGSAATQAANAQQGAVNQRRVIENMLYRQNEAQQQQRDDYATGGARAMERRRQDNEADQARVSGWMNRDRDAILARAAQEQKVTGNRTPPPEFNPPFEPPTGESARAYYMEHPDELRRLRASQRQRAWDAYVAAQGPAGGDYAANRDNFSGLMRGAQTAESTVPIGQAPAWQYSAAAAPPTPPPSGTAMPPGTVIAPQAPAPALPSAEAPDSRLSQLNAIRRRWGI